MQLIKATGIMLGGVVACAVAHWLTAHMAFDLVAVIRKAL